MLCTCMYVQTSSSCFVVIVQYVHSHMHKHTKTMGGHALFNSKCKVNHGLEVTLRAFSTDAPHM